MSTARKLEIGQVWLVHNRTQNYEAKIVGFTPDRVRIVQVKPKAMHATETLALRSMFQSKYAYLRKE